MTRNRADQTKKRAQKARERLHAENRVLTEEREKKEESERALIIERYVPVFVRKCLKAIDEAADEGKQEVRVSAGEGAGAEWPRRPGLLAYHASNLLRKKGYNANVESSFYKSSGVDDMPTSTTVNLIISW